MNTTPTAAKTQIFKMIISGEQKDMVWNMTDVQSFVNSNRQKPPFFGKKAIEQGEASFKAQITFKDGNIIGFRGVKYSQPTYISQVKTLYEMSKQYVRAKTIFEVKIYDNRAILPNNMNLILHWREDKNVLINLLPLYSGEFDFKHKK